MFTWTQTLGTPFFGSGVRLMITRPPQPTRPSSLGDQSSKVQGTCGGSELLRNASSSLGQCCTSDAGPWHAFSVMASQIPTLVPFATRLWSPLTTFFSAVPILKKKLVSACSIHMLAFHSSSLKHIIKCEQLLVAEEWHQLDRVYVYVY
jgi:hypothetical protein